MKHVSNPFRIAENLYCLGPPFLPAYLLDGPEPVMFDAGMSFLGEHYVCELKKLLQDRPLRYLMLSHVHFDHCGATAHLKKVYPELTVCASARAAEIIQKPSALTLIGQLSNLPGLKEDQRFQPFLIDRILDDEEVLQLPGGHQIRVLFTPGHTRDLLSYYLAPQKTLLPSEAAGVPHQDGLIYTEFLVDCDQYFASQERLAALSFDTLLFAHGYVFQGDDARSYFSQALQQGRRFQQRLSELIDRYGDDTASIIRDVRQEEYDFVEEPKQQEDAYLINLQAKIKAVGKWKQRSQL